MRQLGAIVLFAALAANSAGGQETSKPASSEQANRPPVRVKVYTVGPGVTAPQLHPLVPFDTDEGTCTEKRKAKVVLSLIVDSEGLPRNITFLQPFGTEFDRIALRLATADRFTPGTSNGTPVAVAQSLEISVQACVDSIQDATGKQGFLLRLRSQPVQMLGTPPEPPQDAVFTQGSQCQPLHKKWDGKGATAPVPLVNPAAEYSEEARKAKYQGICRVYVIVDAQGMPQIPRVVRPLGMGLDEKAIEAVNKYRFKPAMKDGEPVPVGITVEVIFQLYRGSAAQGTSNLKWYMDRR
jgi:TonB family protein